MSNRLPAQPGEVIDRSSSLSFTWNGKAVAGFEGDTIASAIAADGADVFSRSIDILISRLRHVLEPDPAAPRYIQTVWGRGYMFVPDAPASIPAAELVT